MASSELSLGEYKEEPSGVGEPGLDDGSPQGNIPQDSNISLPTTSDFPEGGTRAWAVACGCAGLLFSTFGYTNSFGVFQEFYQTHQLSHKSPDDISWIGSLQVFALFAGSLIGGPLFDRWGAKVIWPAAVAQVFSVMMTSICKEYYQFLLAQGVLGGIATGMIMTPGLAAVSQYFRAKRGAALGVTVAGSSVGGVIFPIALNKMLHNPSLSFGWTVRIIGFIMLAVLLPSTAAVRARLPPRKTTLFLPGAFRELNFVALMFASFFVLLGMFIPVFYLPSYAVRHGMSQELALYLTAILNGSSFFGRIVPGLLADKLTGRFNMLSISSISTGILCLCWPRVQSHAALIVFAALYGFVYGAIVSNLSACFAQVPKDPRNIGTYLGMGLFVISPAALVGTPICGALLERYGGFEQVAVFSGVVTLFGGVMVLPVKALSGKGLLSRY